MKNNYRAQIILRAAELNEEEIIRFKDSNRSDRKIADICNLACAALNNKSAAAYGTDLTEEEIISFKDRNRDLGWKMADICNLACRAFHINP